MIYDEEEIKKLPKDDLSHTDSYWVEFNAFDIRDNLWKRQGKRYYAPDKDSHGAVRARFRKDMGGRAYCLIEVGYE